MESVLDAFAHVCSPPASPPPAPTKQLRLAPPAVDAKLGSTCRGCHDLGKLVEAKRPGRWHFEQAHKLVMTRKWNCTGCHAEMAPFKAASHKIDRELQSAVCQHCHMSAPFGGRRMVAE